VIDLHQGTTGDELRELEPGWGAVAMLQLEVWNALAKCQLKRAAAGQLATWRLAGRTLLRTLRRPR
jgi:hypothetical protein